VLTTYAVLAFGVLSTDVVSSGDIGVKFVQARALLDNGFRSLTLPNRAEVLDPDGTFSPFRPPFVFETASGTQAIFPPAAAVLQAPLVGMAGIGGMRLLSILATGVILWCASVLVRDRSAVVVPVVLGLATPLWFYAVTESEHATGVAFSTAALLVAGASATPLGAAGAGLLLAAGASVRDECVLLLPALLAATWWRTRSLKAIGWSLAGCSAGLVFAGVVEVWWFQRPLAAHLQHAVHLARSALHLTTTPNPELPTLKPMTQQERYDTVIDYWLIGVGSTIPIVLTAGATILAVIAAWCRRVWPLIAMLAVLSLVAVVDATSIVRAPKFAAGLYRLSPFLIFALLPGARSEDGVPLLKRVTLVAFVTYLALAWIGLDTNGGKSLGPRLILPLVPLLGGAAIVTIDGYLRSDRVPARLIGWCGATLVAASFVMQLAGALPAWITRNSEDADRLAAIAAADQHVLVADNMFTAQELLPLYYRRLILLADTPEIGAALGAVLEREKIPSVLVVSRRLNPDTELPPLDAVWTSMRYRFLIQVWRR
jgi:hypothetical protein